MELTERDIAHRKCVADCKIVKLTKRMEPIVNVKLAVGGWS